MNETGNSEVKVFSTDGKGDPSTMKVNYETRGRQQRIEKDKNKYPKEYDAFPHTMGKNDFQYTSFSAGVNTKIISFF